MRAEPRVRSRRPGPPAVTRARRVHAHGQRRRIVRTALCSAALAAAVLPATARAQSGAPDQPRLRLEYFTEMRAYPFDRIPEGALQAAYRQYRARWPQAVMLPRAAQSALAAELTWSPLGPSPINTEASGRISTVAVHPADSEILYIGGAQGGVWKSTDAGTTWFPLTDGECSLAMGSIAIDPVNPDIVYAGTGELHFSGDSYYGCGLLRSSDGGNTWTQLGASIYASGNVLARIAKVIVDPPTAGTTTATTIYVASSVGLHRSTDSGNTWTRLLDGIVTDLIQHPTNVATLWAAVGSPSGSASNGVYRSDDAGATWTRGASFPNNNVGRIALAIAPSAQATLYAAVQDAFGSGGVDGQLLGIWRTTNGDEWSSVPATGAECGSQCWYDLVIAVDPADAQTVYFGGVGLYRSLNGGQQFTGILNGIHVDQHAITFDPRSPGTLFVGNDGGIYRSDNRGASWISLNNNLAITQFYAGIALHPTDTAIVLGGTQDNGTLEFGGSPVWSLVLNGDGGYAAIDPSNPSIAYAETQWSQGSGFSGPRQRIGPGFFSNRKVLGLNLTDRALFIPPLIMDPVDPSTLYFGTFRVYRTTNRADLWAPISGDLSSTPTGRVSAIAPSQAAPGTIYAGTSDGNVHVTQDAGAQWTLRRTGLPNRFVTDIAVDATDAGTAIATVSGFGTGHVFRTTNFGVDWQDISGNLPDLPVNAVLTSPSLGSTVYIGTDLGVFRTVDLGASWEPFNDGMPNVAVFDLAYSENTGMGVAATHGRGMFSFRASLAAIVVIAQDTVAFSTLGDTLRLSAQATDANGAPVAVNIIWRSSDTTVASVDGSGLVRARGNGEAHVIALSGGAADSTRVRVAQVAVAMTGLPDRTDLVLGEEQTFDANPVDAGGFAIPDAFVVWTTSDPAVLAIDADGRARAESIGDAIVMARLDALVDSTAVRVLPPSTTQVDVVATVVAGAESSSAGNRFALLRVGFTVEGTESVEIVRLGFEVAGDDPGADFLLIEDRNDSGTLDDTDVLVATVPVNLRPDAPATVTVSPSGFVVAPDARTTLLAVLRMSGAAPNGSTFQAKYIPAATSTLNRRSRVRDRVVQPATPVSSALLQTSVLEGGILSLSENPVRSGSLIFNFAEPPSMAAVYTLSGRRVIDLTQRLDTEGRGVWDLRNEEGTAVAPGVYLVIFRVQGQLFRERLIVLRRDDEPAH